MIMGFPPNRLMRWAGSLPWTTRLWQEDKKASQKSGGISPSVWHQPTLPPWIAWPRPTSQTRPSCLCVCGVELTLQHTGLGRARGVLGKLETPLSLKVPRALPQSLSHPRRTCPADLTLSLGQEAREPMFSNVPLNGSTGIIRGHASRMVTSAPGTKASGGEKQTFQIWRPLPHSQCAPDAGCRYRPRYITSAPAHVPSQILIVAP